MDYEKKYNEALAWMREVYPELQGAAKEDAEHYFPELKESEDERIRMELKEAFEAYDIESTWNGIPIRSIFAWLEKQKEQKPAEWSEEDEKKLASAIAHIEDSQCFDHYYNIRKDDIIGWLKSLRPQPHWKPSEVQMSMLLAVIRDSNNAGSESCSLAFKSLYDDLKKL